MRQWTPENYHFPRKLIFKTLLRFIKFPVPDSDPNNWSNNEFRLSDTSQKPYSRMGLCSDFFIFFLVFRHCSCYTVYSWLFSLIFSERCNLDSVVLRTKQEMASICIPASSIWVEMSIVKEINFISRFTVGWTIFIINELLYPGTEENAHVLWSNLKNWNNAHGHI